MSARSRQQRGFEFGSDSFLDIVANIVGILIILVVVVGVRIQHSPIVQARPVEPPAEPVAAEVKPEMIEEKSPHEKALNRETGKLASLARGLSESAADLARLQMETALRHRERTTLAYQKALLESKLDQRRQSLNASQSAEFQASREVSAVKNQIDQIDRNLQSLKARPKKVLKVAHQTTPLSRTVFGDEEFFQIQDDRVVYVPKETLLNLIREDMQRLVFKLKNQPTVSSSVGPVDGFRVDYHMTRRQARGGMVVEVTRWSLIPVVEGMGETLEEALAPGSRFRAILARLNPKRSAITLWVYPDSFETFRVLQSELQKLGFQTAGRPLPAGMPISGSPHGTRSAAQ